MYVCMCVCIYVSAYVYVNRIAAVGWLQVLGWNTDEYMEQHLHLNAVGFLLKRSHLETHIHTFILFKYFITNGFYIVIITIVLFNCCNDYHSLDYGKTCYTHYTRYTLVDATQRLRI